MATELEEIGRVLAAIKQSGASLEVAIENAERELKVLRVIRQLASDAKPRIRPERRSRRPKAVPVGQGGTSVPE